MFCEQFENERRKARCHSAHMFLNCVIFNFTYLVGREATFAAHANV